MKLFMQKLINWYVQEKKEYKGIYMTYEGFKEITGQKGLLKYLKYLNSL